MRRGKFQTFPRVPSILFGVRGYNRQTFRDTIVKKDVIDMGKTTAFLLGVSAGAIAALMLTPKNGQENRQLVADAANTFAGQSKEFVSNAGENLRSGVKTATGRVQDFAGQAGENLRSGVKSVADQAAPVADDIRIKINEARDRIAEQVTNRRANVKTVAADVSDVAADIKADVEKGAAKVKDDVAAAQA